MRSLFPALTAPSVKSRVALRWSFDRGLPLPKWQICCPCCGSLTVLLRNWIFNRRPSGPRCQVSFKCCDCSMAWIHGVVISEDMWSRFENEKIEWREGMKLLGYGEAGI